MQHFDGDFALVAEVMGQVHRRHAAGTELALDPVAVGEGGGQARQRIGNGGIPWSEVRWEDTVIDSTWR